MAILLLSTTLAAPAQVASDTTQACRGEIAKLADPASYTAGMTELERRASECLPALLGVLFEPSTNDHTWGSIAGILCRMENRPKTVDDTIIALANPMAGVERARRATRALSCLPVDRAVPSLREALKSDDALIRQAAIRSFSGSAVLVRALLPEVLEKVRGDSSEEVRCWSAEAIESLPDPTAALPALRESARSDHSTYVRECVQETVGILAKKQSARE